MSDLVSAGDIGREILQKANCQWEACLGESKEDRGEGRISGGDIFMKNENSYF